MTTGSEPPVPGGPGGPGGPPAPAGDPADDGSRTERIDALAAYFRANAVGFTSEALRQAALDAGHQPREVDAAWAVAAVPVPTRGPASARSALVTVAYIAGTYAITFVLAVIPETSGLAIAALGLALVLGILAWLLLRDARPDLAEGFKFGVVLAIVVPLVITLVVLGVCLVLIAGAGLGAAP